MSEKCERCDEDIESGGEFYDDFDMICQVCYDEEMESQEEWE